MRRSLIAKYSLLSESQASMHIDSRNLDHDPSPGGTTHPVVSSPSFSTSSIAEPRTAQLSTSAQLD